MSSVSAISHNVRLLPQCFSTNDALIKRVYYPVCMPLVLMLNTYHSFSCQLWSKNTAHLTKVRGTNLHTRQNNHQANECYRLREWFECQKKILTKTSHEEKLIDVDLWVRSISTWQGIWITTLNLKGVMCKLIAVTVVLTLYAFVTRLVLLALHVISVAIMHTGN